MTTLVGVAVLLMLVIIVLLLVRRRGTKKIKDENSAKSAHVQSPIVPVHVTETKKTFDEADTTGE